MDKELKLALKAYKKAQEFKTIDRKKSTLYLYKSLQTLGNLKSKNEDKYKDIITETEMKCKDLLDSTIKQTETEHYSREFIEEKLINGDLDFFKKHSFHTKTILKFNNKGNTLVHEAIELGDSSVVKILLCNNDVSLSSLNIKGHTLLEHAVFCKDSNMAEFLINHGADIEKISFYRNNKKIQLKLKVNNIDVACLLKILVLNSPGENKIDERLLFLNDHFGFDKECGIGNFTFKTVMLGISHLLLDYLDTYTEILKEELNFALRKSISCYRSKLEILMYNILPFMEIKLKDVGLKYTFTISSENMIVRELRYSLSKQIKNKKISEITDKDKMEFVNKIYKDYVNSGLYKEDYIGIQINKILRKLKQHKTKY